MGASAFVGVLLVLSGLGAGAPDQATLQCGSLAPFENGCAGCCAAYTGTANATAGTFLFVGRVDITLQGASGGLAWSCWSILVDDMLPAPLPQVGLVPPVLDGVLWHCWGPSVQGAGLVLGEQVSLACRAGPSDATRLPVALGPLGPWGCKVVL